MGFWSEWYISSKFVVKSWSKQIYRQFIKLVLNFWKLSFTQWPFQVINEWSGHFVGLWIRNPRDVRCAKMNFKHHSHMSLAKLSSSGFLPPNLLIYEQLVVLSIKILTWTPERSLQKVSNASWHALSSRILIWFLCSDSDHWPPIFTFFVLFTAPHPFVEKIITEGCFGVCIWQVSDPPFNMWIDMWRNIHQTVKISDVFLHTALFHFL